jgi:hypothetical protein
VSQEEAPSHAPDLGLAGTFGLYFAIGIIALAVAALTIKLGGPMFAPEEAGTHEIF